MTNRRLLAESLLYHWRSHCALSLCVATGTAVLTGALLVGDSMRGSLREMVLGRLGRVDYGLVADRFFGQEMTNRLGMESPRATGGATEELSAIVPAIILRGSAAKTDDTGRETARAGRIQVLGVPLPFWLLGRSGHAPAWLEQWYQSAGDTGVVLNDTLAREWDVGIDDTLLLRIARPTDIPREGLLGRKDDVVLTLRLRVAGVAEAGELGRFQLQSSQRSPRNVYLPLDALAQSLGQPGRANAMLASTTPQTAEGDAGERLDPAMTQQTLGRLQQALHAQLQLDDLGLRMRIDAERGYISLESTRMLLEPSVEAAALEAARELGLATAPTLSYLANSIVHVPRDNRASGMPNSGSTAGSLVEMPFALAGKLAEPFRLLAGAARTREVPYSTVAALPLDAAGPLGPLRLASGDPAPELGDDEILLNSWAAEDLRVGPGDSVALVYFLAEPAKPFETAATTFRVRGVVEMQGVAADPGLVPEYPGISDATSYADWDPPFPMDLKRVRPKDEQYWDKHRTTPKAFVSLATGERLWGSRFGRRTSIRLAPAAGSQPGELQSSQARFAQALLTRLKPEQVGFRFEPVKAQGLAAATGGTDFSSLFVGFSLFLIASASILVGLVFRLSVERRAREVGTLLAVGFSRRTITALFLAEGLAVAGAGTLLGLVGAVGYARLMMAGLRTWWLPAVGTTLVRIHVEPASLAIGTAAGLVLATLAIFSAVRGLARISTRALLAGSTTESTGLVRPDPRWSRVVAWGGLTISFVQLPIAFWLKAPWVFFVAGSVLLATCLAFLSLWLVAGRDWRVGGHGVRAIARLGARSGSRHRGRSVLTATLVASATFVIVTVAANRQDAATEVSERNSGTGGFALVGESDLPLLYDLNTPDGRGELGISDSAAAVLEGVRVYPFRLRPGEDASCLNLYQPTRPRILGATPAMIARSGFRVHSSLAESRDERENTWRLLYRELPGGAVPAIGDANSVKWILKLGLGQQLTITAEDGREVPLEIVALLDRSILQSELVISEANFRKLFPSQSGYSYFMIEHANNLKSQISNLKSASEISNSKSGSEISNSKSGSQIARLKSPDDNAAAVAPSAMSSQRSTLNTQLSTFFEQHLSDYGFDATSTAERLAEYHAVENAYLSTFQMLGGLGLMLGTLGLGAVLLRSVLERRGELALLLAVGFRRRDLIGLILAENGFLLFAGLAAGTVSALFAVAPHLLNRAGDLPWLSLAATLCLVLLVGMSAAAAAVMAALRTPLLTALRSE